MKGSECKFVKFMEGADKRFVIPVYQRKYNWSDAQCTTLWEDIKKLADKDGSSGHFIGSVVCYKLTDIDLPGEIKEEIIIDGQQRITTLSLLMIAICRLYESLAKKNQDTDLGNSYSKTDHDATFMHMKEDHMKNGQLKPGYNIQVATTDQYVVDFALYPNPTDFKTLEPFLKQMTTMDKFDKIVADAGYGSEYNYSMLEEEYSDKQYYIPYTMYEKEQTRKYKNDPTKLANWFYDEEDDYYLDQNGVRFSFKCYSRRKDKSTGQVRDFKVYEADKFQLTPELERLAKTKSGRQRQVRYNPNWQYLKEKAKGVLQSPEGRYIYSKRKYDVEPVFGHLKNVFGMRRTHLRGKKKVETDVGIAFMMMNLSKYWNRRWSKDQSSLRKNKNNKKKTVKQLKLRVGLIVFWYLKVSFFPDTFHFINLK